jgi:shikimate dehydrogenase
MTDPYAVIGNPVSHSKSPLIHALFAAQTGQDMSYVAIEAPLDGFEATVLRLKAEGFKGANVTVPFKFKAFELCDKRTERAKAAQAVNTLSFEDGQVGGDNTDGAGLVADITRNLEVDLSGKKVLLLGAGGAAYGVVRQLLGVGCKVVVANRTVEKAEQMAKEFASFGRLSASSFEALAGQSFDVVINATSSGLADEMPPLPPGLFAPHALAYDMMYGRETPFMKFARRQGVALVSDGLGMLVEQAAEAFYIWRGVRPETAPVLAKLRAS